MSKQDSMLTSSVEASDQLNHRDMKGNEKDHF